MRLRRAGSGRNQRLSGEGATDSINAAVNDAFCAIPGTGGLRATWLLR